MIVPAHAEPRFGQTEQLHLFRGDKPLVVVLTTIAKQSACHRVTRRGRTYFCPLQIVLPPVCTRLVPLALARIRIGWNVARNHATEVVIASSNYIAPINAITVRILKHGLSCLAAVSAAAKILKVFRTMLSFSKRNNMIYLISNGAITVDSPH